MTERRSNYRIQLVVAVAIVIVAIAIRDVVRVHTVRPAVPRPATQPALQLLSYTSSSAYAHHMTTTTIDGKVRNNTGIRCRAVTIKFDLLDSRGKLVDTVVANAPRLDPHGMWNFKAINARDYGNSCTDLHAKMVYLHGWD